MGVCQNHIGSLPIGRGVQGSFQILLAIFNKFTTEVASETGNAFFMHPQQGKDLEKPLNARKIFIFDSFREPPSNNAPDSSLSLVQSGKTAFKANTTASGLSPLKIPASHLEKRLVHAKEPMDVSSSLFIIFFFQSSADALTAPAQVYQVLHPLLALRHPALSKIQLANLRRHSLGQASGVGDQLGELLSVPSHVVEPGSHGQPPLQPGVKPDLLFQHACQLIPHSSLLLVKLEEGSLYVFLTAQAGQV